MNLTKIVDELLDSQDPWSKFGAAAKDFYPPVPSVDLYEVDGGIELKADLPGMDKQDISLKVEQSVLTLSGERKHSEEQQSKYFYSERKFGKFKRAYRLPFHADPSTVSASFEYGVLTVYIPQPESTKEGLIEIQ